MIPGRSIVARVSKLERSVPHRCAACAGRTRDQVLFYLNDVLQTHEGVPVDESVLLPCPVCGSRPDSSVKVVANVDPSAV